MALKVLVPLPRRDFDPTEAAGLNAYAEMSCSTEFMRPLKWSSLVHQDFEALLLPGGHAAGMREYLESTAPTFRRAGPATLTGSRKPF